MSLSKEQFRATEDKNKKEGFNNWLDQPMTRTLVSMIPPSEHKDLIQTILRASFEAGFNCGSGSTMIQLVEHMIKEPPHCG